VMTLAILISARQKTPVLKKSVGPNVLGAAIFWDLISGITGFAVL
jgi:hypothetical protein